MVTGCCIRTASSPELSCNLQREKTNKKRQRRHSRAKPPNHLLMLLFRTVNVTPCKAQPSPSASNAFPPSRFVQPAAPTEPTSSSTADPGRFLNRGSNGLERSCQVRKVYKWLHTYTSTVRKPDQKEKLEQTLKRPYSTFSRRALRKIRSPLSLIGKRYDSYV